VVTRHTHTRVHPPHAPRGPLCHSQRAARRLAGFSARAGEKGRGAGSAARAGLALQLNTCFKSLSALETAREAPGEGMLPSHTC